MWIIKIIKIKYFYPPRIPDEYKCIYSCLQIPPRENWFQYVRRVYATAINFPCISTLGGTICHFFDKKYPDLFSMCLKKVSIVKKQNKKLIFFLTFKFLYIVIHLCKRKYFFIKLCSIWVPKNQSWNTEFKNVKIIKICFTWTCYGQIKNWKLGLTWCKQYSYNYLSILQRKVLKQFCYELIWFLKKWLINQWKLFFSLNYFLL